MEEDLFLKEGRSLRNLQIYYSTTPLCTAPLHHHQHLKIMIPYPSFLVAVGWRCLPRKKASIHHHHDLSLSPSVARPRGHRAKKLWFIPFPMDKQGKTVNTTGPEGRVYTIEASDPAKKKRRVSTVVVHTCFYRSGSCFCLQPQPWSQRKVLS